MFAGCVYFFFIYYYYYLFVFVCSSHGLGWMLLRGVLFYECLLCAAIYRIRASYSLQARQALLRVFACVCGEKDRHTGDPMTLEQKL